MIACAEPRCPNPAVYRGRCFLHRKTTAQKGYGFSWQQRSRNLRAIRRRCERCGATQDLTVDHVVPHNATLLRVLCRHCHGVVGAQSNRSGRSKSLAARDARMSLRADCER